MTKYKECPNCGEVLDDKKTKCYKCETELHLQKEKNKKKILIISTKERNQLLKIVGGILLIFFLYNFLIFSYIALKASKEPIYPEARMYLRSAEKINNLYIFPLSRSFGWESPITIPFYAIRDYLYNKGLSKLPVNEGEKEIWWYKIRYIEFRELVEKNLEEYCLNKYPQQYLYDKKDDFIKWNNELYSHIEPMAKAKIKDKEFRKQKLAVFVDLAVLSQGEDYCLSTALELQRQGKFMWPSSRAGVRPNIKEVLKFDKVYNLYISLLDYSKKYEKDSYDYFLMNRKLWGLELSHNIAQSILLVKFYDYTLDCNDKYLKIFVDAQKEIRDYYYINADSLPFGLKMRFGMDALTTHPMIAYKCRNNPCMKDYIEYILQRKIKDNRIDAETLKKIKSISPKDTIGKFEIWGNSTFSKYKDINELEKDKRLMGIK